jgi:hypothetical protein
MTGGANRPLIVVGVDGSPCSVEALRWGARQAELTGGEVHALTAWSLPEIYSYTPRDFETEARKTLDDAILQALGAGPSVEVRADVVEGHAAETLTAASRGGATSRRRQPRPRRVHRDAPRVGQPALRHARALPRRRRLPAARLTVRHA